MPARDLIRRQLLPLVLRAKKLDRLRQILPVRLDGQVRRILLQGQRSQEFGGSFFHRCSGQESGVRSQESGVRGQGSGVRGQESGVRSQESENRRVNDCSMTSSF